jgi:hypothetical protein
LSSPMMPDMRCSMCDISAPNPFTFCQGKLNGLI